MKLYCPPERGIMALSSAKVSAPPSVRIPATRYASSTIHGVPTLHVMTRALTKTPVPMTLVTMRAVAGMSVSPLTRDLFISSRVRKIQLHKDRDRPKALRYDVVRRAGLESKRRVHGNRFVHEHGGLQAHDDIACLFCRRDEGLRQLSP